MKPLTRRFYTCFRENFSCSHDVMTLVLTTGDGAFIRLNSVTPRDLESASTELFEYLNNKGE